MSLSKYLLIFEKLTQTFVQFFFTQTLEELRRNVEMERITTSQAITDLKSYIRKEELYDPMINPPKDNPFQPGFKICKILIRSKSRVQQIFLCNPRY